MAQQVVISFNANANFSDLIGEIKRANAEIATLQTQLNGLGSSSFTSINNLNKQFIEGMRNTRLWSSAFVDVANETREFGRHLDQGRLKLKDYFREFSTQVRGQRGMIRRLAEEQVKLQRSILTTTVGPSGEQRNILSTPTGLDKMDPTVMKALRSEQFKIVGRAIQGVSTELINLGKNTQWAGRQLTVGLTVPLTIFASTAAMAFRDVDKELTRLAKVYGDVGGATTGEIARIKEETSSLARELAASLGAPAKETIGLAADIAATGKMGTELLGSIRETTRLSILGEVGRQEAMSATLSLQSAFNLSTQELAESINFLNAVENQTTTSLEDLVIAIPKAGPVVRQLGGDVQDLALFLTAMREGGINASEAANALKSGLASIINPTKQTREVLSGMGIDIENIVTRNAGDLVGTVTALKDAFNELDPLARARAIEQMFGKFQFARISALFDNLGKSGSQTLQVMELMGASTVELAALADRELSTLTESASGKFQRQLETLRANLATTGESFLGIFSKVLGTINKILESFNNLPDGVKTVVTVIGALVGLAGPIIMLSGVFLNFFGYLVKTVGFLGRFFTGTKKFELLDEQMMGLKLSTDRAANAFYDQAQATDAAKASLDRLIEGLQRLMAMQETMSSGAVIRPERYIPTADIQSGKRFHVRGSEFSHYLSKPVREQMSPEVAEALQLTREEAVKAMQMSGVIGKYIPKDGKEAALQKQLGSDMPAMIYDAGLKFEDAVNQLRTKLLTAADKIVDVRSRDITKATITQATPETIMGGAMSSTQFAARAGVSAGITKVIAESIDQMGVQQGFKVADEIKKAWLAAGPEEALNTAKQIASTMKVGETQLLDLMHAEMAQATNETIRAFTAGGPDEAAKAAMIAELRAGKQILDATGTKITASTKEGLFRMIAAISQGSSMADNIQVVEVKAAMDKLGMVTLTYIDGLVLAFDQAGNAIKIEDAESDPIIKSEIAKLKASAQNLNTAVTKEIVDANIDLQNATRNAQQTADSTPTGRRGSDILGRDRTKMKQFGSSMAMMGLGMATTMMPTGKAGDIGGAALMGASMGMMSGLGVQGALAGAALAALIPVIKMTVDQFKIMNGISQLRVSQYQLDIEYAKAAGINLKSLADIQLQQLAGNTEEAASALQMMTQAAKEAAIETTAGKLREAAKKSNNFSEIQREFENQFLTFIASGVSEKTAMQLMAGILSAADKAEYSTDLKMSLSKYKGLNPADATAALITGAAKQNSIINTEYEKALQNENLAGLNPNLVKSFLAQGRVGGAETLYNQAPINTATGEKQSVFSTLEQAQALDQLVLAYKKLDQEQQRSILTNQLQAQQFETLSAAIANQDMEGFAESMDKVRQSGDLSADSVKQIATGIEGLSAVENTVLHGLINNGVESADVMLALKMRVEGVIPSLQAVRDFDGMKIRATFEMYMAKQQVEDAKENLKAALQSQFQGTSSTAGDDARKKALQAQIDALEEIERKEKNLNRLRELGIKYEEKRRGLAVDYLSALASGDLESALRAQLDMQAANLEYVKERNQAEKEISREDKKKALQDEMKALDKTPPAVDNTSKKVEKMEKDIESFVQKMVKGFKTGGEIGSVLDEFSTSQELANFKSKFQNLLSPEALQKAIETLKSELQAAKAALDAAAAGLSGSTGFTDLPRDISNLLPAAGFTLPEGKDKIATALSGEQKKKLILAAEASGIPFAPDAKLTIFGETYRYDKNKNDLIRQPKPGERKWSGGKIRGYYAGGGGAIFGAGNSVNDMNLIAASNKEFMMRAKAVEHYGMPFMESINNTLYDPQAIMQKFAKRYDESGKNIISVNVDKIEITEPGASAEEIIDTMEKKLFGAIKRKTDKRYITI